MQITETTSNTINGNDRIESILLQGINATSSQLTLSDQLYRQAKIDEENRCLKKKSKTDGELSKKKGKKLSEKSDRTLIDDNNDDDIYPTVKVIRGGELPEDATENGNEDNDYDVTVGKNKNYDTHRALNIDLNEKPIQSIPASPPPLISQ
ncbi:unnamed protein product [Rotaria sordida]|uniref:AP-3 complex subunit delta domain-containing protein n=1 Tax=Rotaria sordida TaxID=392033 RepID=A0A816C8Z1_9BILA|nr:unnamed protein product [Rotaria sordida]CAF1451358.1 unnamed protein product [Rotaria sordida]CAF1504662.1 unnamed protein product [Rotaria sordida]CAF1618347.1 unnamed protein product [Rotaria sordida]CAF4163376.1 unnamed protein product [Rotaria sordida]